MKDTKNLQMTLEEYTTIGRPQGQTPRLGPEEKSKIGLGDETDFAGESPAAENRKIQETQKQNEEHESYGRENPDQRQCPKGTETESDGMP